MTTNASIRILVTGGHVTPAYAVIEELRKRGYAKIYFVGRRYTDRAYKDESLEYKEITSLQIPFYHLTTGRLTRTVSINALYDALAILYGVVMSLFLINKIKPKIILSFGGYLALPICLVGWLLGVKIITHEQTITPGIANRIIATIADKVCVAFPGTERQFGSHKTILTGNPVRKKILQKGNRLFDPNTNKPLLFVTGGSLGSHALNVHIERILPKLLEKFTVIHQVGNVSEYSDHDRLSAYGYAGYYVYKNLPVDSMAWAYNNSVLVVARSGANTVWELLMLKKPAVLIPLPWSGGDEQKKQADFFVAQGLGRKFDQADSSTTLLHTITKVYENRARHTAQFARIPKEMFLPAAATIVGIIEECAS